MDEEKLKPCPFCGNDGVIYQSALDGYVFCPICFAVGPSPVAEKSAVEMWNRAPRPEEKHG